MDRSVVAARTQDRPESFVHIARPRYEHRAVVWSVRALILVPFVLMGPELFALAVGRANAVHNLSESTADVLGTSSFVLFVLMLTVTPIHTMTGWRWHLVLRHDLGVGMFAVALTDLALAATTTGETFGGGLAARVGGHTFLAVGTLATLLLIPLGITANRWAKLWLGKYWKWIHRTTYVVWALIMLHLLLLFALRGFFVDALILSTPLALLRIPAVRRTWVESRQRDTHGVIRLVAAAIVVCVFAIGFVPFVQELAVKGAAAIVQRPVDD